MFSDSNNKIVINKSSINNNFFELCKNAEAIQIEAHIKKIVDVNVRDIYGNTVMVYAVVNNGRTDVISMLIKNGVSIYNVDSKGRNAFYYAVNYSTVDIVQMFLKAFFKPNELYNTEYTMFAYACSHNQNIEIIKLLVEHGADVFALGKDNTDILMLACKSNKNIEIIKLLVDMGLDVKNKDDHGKTALLYASEHDANTELIKYLISCGADINARDNEGKTILMYLIYTSIDNELMKDIISHGADVNTCDRNGKTLLMLAAMLSFDIELIKMILKNTRDIYQKDKNGLSAIFYAAKNIVIPAKVIILLMKENFDLEETDNAKNSFYSYAKDNDILLGEDALFKKIKKYENKKNKKK